MPAPRSTRRRPGSTAPRRTTWRPSRTSGPPPPSRRAASPTRSSRSRCPSAGATRWSSTPTRASARAPTVESLGGLRPAFDKAGNITAGNASQISDGGAAVIVASQGRGRAPRPRRARRDRRLRPGGGSRPVAAHPAVAGDQRRRSSRRARSVGEIDLFELNEAFAAVGIASMQDLGISDDVVNVNGGAIALGHPVGMSGTRVALTMLHELQASGRGSRRRGAVRRWRPGRRHPAVRLEQLASLDGGAAGPRPRPPSRIGRPRAPGSGTGGHRAHGRSHERDRAATGDRGRAGRCRRPRTVRLVVEAVVQPRARRHPRRRRGRRAAVPRRLPVGPRWLPGRLHVLHALGLPHHVPAARRAQRPGQHRPPHVLVAAHAPAAARVGASRSWPSPIGSRLWTDLQTPGLSGDIVASALQVANWRFLFDDQSYADLFATPSPVLHFWSLAIEEQFYWVFPLLTAGVFLVAKGSVKVYGAVLAGLLAVSALATALLGFSESTTVYYATYTRMGEILVGSLLAVALSLGLTRLLVVQRLAAVGRGRRPGCHGLVLVEPRAGDAVHLAWRPARLLVAVGRPRALGVRVRSAAPPAGVRAAAPARPHLLRRLPRALADLPGARRRSAPASTGCRSSSCASPSRWPSPSPPTTCSRSRSAGAGRCPGCRCRRWPGWPWSRWWSSGWPCPSPPAATPTPASRPCGRTPSSRTRWPCRPTPSSASRSATRRCSRPAGASAPGATRPKTSCCPTPRSPTHSAARCPEAANAGRVVTSPRRLPGARAGPRRSRPSHSACGRSTGTSSSPWCRPARGRSPTARSRATTSSGRPATPSTTSSSTTSSRRPPTCSCSRAWWSCGCCRPRSTWVATRSPRPRTPTRSPTTPGWTASTRSSSASPTSARARSPSTCRATCATRTAARWTTGCAPTACTSPLDTAVSGVERLPRAGDPPGGRVRAQPAGPAAAAARPQRAAGGDPELPALGFLISPRWPVAATAGISRR